MSFDSFQQSKLAVDWLSYYLTPAEEKVLTRATREIQRGGNTSQIARIPMSVFVSGRRKEGTVLSLGCGLNKGTIRKALNSLNRYNVLRKVGWPTNKGQKYELVESDAINWNALERRRWDWDIENERRTVAARKVSNTKHSPIELNMPDAISPGYVYILKAGEWYKIGYSTNVKKRLEKLMTAPPFPTEVVHIIGDNDYIALEKRPHERFAEKRVGGEWFLLEPDDIEWIKAL